MFYKIYRSQHRYPCMFFLLCKDIQTPVKKAKFFFSCLAFHTISTAHCSIRSWTFQSFYLSMVHAFKKLINSHLSTTTTNRSRESVLESIIFSSKYKLSKFELELNANRSIKSTSKHTIWMKWNGDIMVLVLIVFSSLYVQCCHLKENKIDNVKTKLIFSIMNMQYPCTLF